MNRQRPPTSRTKALPKIKEQLGPPIKLNFVKVYAPKQGVVVKAHVDNGDAPQLFIDLEHPRGDFEQMKDTELHLGISASFRVEPIRNSKVKTHIDLYLPKSEISKLLQLIVQANLIRRRNLPHAPVGPASWPQDPPTIRYSADVRVSGQRESSGGASQLDQPPSTEAGKGSFNSFFPPPRSLARPTAPQARPSEKREGD